MENRIALLLEEAFHAANAEWWSEGNNQHTEAPFSYVLKEFMDLTKPVQITAEDVKALRDVTGCGLMQAKEALIACKGNKEHAGTYLHLKGTGAFTAFKRGIGIV